MSPRRKVYASDVDIFGGPAPKPPRRWGLPVFAGAAALLVLAAITASALLLTSHVSEHRTVVKETEALSYVRGFMTDYTTLDPFHANDYADRVLAQGTGAFAKSYKDQMNQIVAKVATADPTTGSVLEAGVQKLNDDGSIDVLVAAAVSDPSPAGKARADVGSRWLVTAIEEGSQWKISQLVRVV